MMGLENEAISVKFQLTQDELMKVHRQYLFARKIIWKHDNVFIAAFFGIFSSAYFYDLAQYP